MQQRRPVSRQSKSFTRRRRERSTVALGLALGCVALWLFVFSRLSGMGLLTIDTIEVVGADEDIIAGVRAAAAETLVGDYGYILSRANFLLYPKSDITRAVEQSSPRIKNVSVSRHGINTLVLKVKEKEPAAIVCPKLPDVDEGELSQLGDSQCLFADESGLLYVSAPVVSGTLYNRYYAPTLSGAVTPEKLSLGVYATSSQEFSALQSFYASLRDHKIDPVAILFKEDGEYEAYVRNPKQGAGMAVIYFNNKRSLSEELDNLILFWNRALEDGLTRHTVPAFEYIDLRYGSNVFFRDAY